MEKNIFKLDNEQLKAIVCSFRDKTEEGLKTENAEIQCIPTFIAPKTTHIKGKSLVLDLGGTNYRVAIEQWLEKRHVNYEVRRIYPRRVIQRIGRYDYRNQT